jgi:hypothetical protein
MSGGCCPRPELRRSRGLPPESWGALHHDTGALRTIPSLPPPPEQWDNDLVPLLSAAAAVVVVTVTVTAGATMRVRVVSGRPRHNRWHLRRRSSTPENCLRSLLIATGRKTRIRHRTRLGKPETTPHLTMWRQQSTSIYPHHHRPHISSGLNVGSAHPSPHLRRSLPPFKRSWDTPRAVAFARTVRSRARGCPSPPTLRKRRKRKRMSSSSSSGWCPPRQGRRRRHDVRQRHRHHNNKR